ncbi:glycoside hydrolase family 68 protein [Microbacterium stercoris]|uniref:Glycoside hydrolase family 68 protein n=1 Tax=Microbacterium stercoris TaxID=2820289 RepID=A0A939QKY6_9MICO|nr:glycoside hydrolase family 68 protein [Microbacterium stercoris]MBO3662695.1 glycoside hydrolase family 68 protein [Microbacterium stercoris]
MTFTLPDHWVWDFWIADTGTEFHLFYLHAPRSLGDPHQRHRNAMIGHAISADLREWRDLGPILGPGTPDRFDGTAKWTGSVVRGDDGRWRMFYTGSRFLHPVEHTNIESVGVAVSDDLHEWEPSERALITADSRWYETLADRTWHEEAWRDPWVYRDEDGWHMLITARAAHRTTHPGVDRRDLGVVGHATSADLIEWTAAEPLSAPGSGFGHLEVLQRFDWEGRTFVLFSCDLLHLAGARRESASAGGIWVAEESADGAGYRIEESRLLADESLYAGRIVADRAGGLALMAFRNGESDGTFVGGLIDPIPLVSDADGWPALAAGAHA